MRRRDFITLLGGVMAWPLSARAENSAIPIVAHISAGNSAGAPGYLLSALRQGLADGGFVAGRNVVIESYWAEGQYDQLPNMVSELVRRRVAVIVATPTAAALAAKAATADIPIVFAVADDPVKLGLVSSLARPDGNATGVNFYIA